MAKAKSYRVELYEGARDRSPHRVATVKGITKARELSRLASRTAKPGSIFGYDVIAIAVLPSEQRIEALVRDRSAPGLLKYKRVKTPSVR